jgi:hypothetical protein
MIHATRSIRGRCRSPSADTFHDVCGSVDSRPDRQPDRHSAPARRETCADGPARSARARTTTEAIDAQAHRPAEHPHPGLRAHRHRPGGRVRLQRHAQDHPRTAATSVSMNSRPERKFSRNRLPTGQAAPYSSRGPSLVRTSGIN